MAGIDRGGVVVLVFGVLTPWLVVVVGSAAGAAAFEISFAAKLLAFRLAAGAMAASFSPTPACYAASAARRGTTRRA